MTFHATIKFIINSLTDKVLVQSCQICAMYTIWRWFWCAVTGTLTCVCKTFTTLRRTFFGSNASMNHACLICKSNLLYIDTCLYIFVLYTLFNIIYLIKSWKKKISISLLNMNPICLAHVCFFSVVDIISKVKMYCEDGSMHTIIS